MTEKTPKTPRSDQPSVPSKDPATAPDVIKPDSGGTKKPASEAPEPQKPADAVKAPAAASTSAAQDTPVSASSASTSSKSKATPQATATTPASKTSTSTTPTAATSPDPAASPAGRGGRSNGAGAPPATPGPAPSKPSAVPLVVITVVVILLAGALWYQHATSRDAIERLESQSRTSADQARQAEQMAQQALDSLNRQQDMIASLRSELQESKVELEGLSTAFQTITDRGSELVLLNDIDHLMTIAQQQLQLNGNVANAIISLETAQAQLARASRPALASLQQTINGDLDRLRAATTVDIALLSNRLDELAGLVSQAPLLVPDDAAPKLDVAPDDSPRGSVSGASSSGVDDGAWWEKALARTQQWTARTFASLRQDLGGFISVRRVDDAAALLISPDQATRFRDSLRQRIMTAQLALMMDQSGIWETETDALLKAIESRFDPQSAVTRQAVRIAREVADTAIDAPLPDVTNSIKALEAINAQMGRGAPSGNGVSPSQDESGPAADSQAPETSPDADDDVPAAQGDSGADMPEQAPETPDTSGMAKPGAEDDTDNAADDTGVTPDTGMTL